MCCCMGLAPAPGGEQNSSPGIANEFTDAGARARPSGRARARPVFPRGNGKPSGDRPRCRRCSVPSPKGGGCGISTTRGRIPGTWWKTAGCGQATYPEAPVPVLLSILGPGGRRVGREDSRRRGGRALSARQAWPAPPAAPSEIPGTSKGTPFATCCGKDRNGRVIIAGPRSPPSWWFRTAPADFQSFVGGAALGIPFYTKRRSRGGLIPREDSQLLAFLNARRQDPHRGRRELGAVATWAQRFFKLDSTSWGGPAPLLPAGRKVLLRRHSTRPRPGRNNRESSGTVNNRRARNAAPWARAAPGTSRRRARNRSQSG